MKKQCENNLPIPPLSAILKLVMNNKENYLDWHFVKIPKSIADSSQNLFIFITYFFSTGSLLRTLFAPWKRQVIKKRSPGWSFTEFFEVLTFNLISRFIGALARLFLILAWFIAGLMTVIFGILAFSLWIILPGFTFPLYLLFKKRKTKLEKLIGKKISDPEEWLATFSQSPVGQFTLSRLLLNTEEVQNLSFTKKEKEKFNKNWQEFLKSKTSLPNSRDALAFLIKQLTPFKKFLAKKKLKTKDALSLINWFFRSQETALENVNPLKLENLLKIPPLGKNLAFGYTPTLNRYCTDLARPLPYSHHLVGRQRETSQMEQILSRTTGNNVLLVGEPGVGRHTIVEEFAKKIKEGRVNPSLAHKRILDLGLRRLLSEAKSAMSAKGVIESVLAEAAYAGNIILVIENFDQYVSIGPGRIDLTNIFIKAVQSGVQIIGITTFADFAKYLYPNQELFKGFGKVEASPPSNEEALIILQDTLPFYEQRSHVFVTFQALKETIDKVDKYVVHIPFPEKAIDLLDETCVYASQKNIKIITPKEINQVISDKTKIPLGEIQEEEAQKLQNLESIIHRRIINQKEAVIAIARAMRRARTGIAKSNRPIGTFLFMGPTGVGKTETAKALAEAYFGSDDRMIRFDMSEFQGRDALDRIIGSAQSSDPGLFAKAIRKNPFSLLLLDEIEKTHSNILNLFLTMIDEGYFTDAFGQKVDCRNLIIIGTSNAGTELIRQRIGQISEAELEQEIIDHVQREGIFSPEFVNRFDAVVIYHPLSHEHLKQIAGLMLANLNKRLKKKELRVKITEELLEKVVKLGYDPAFGARPMNRVIQDQIEDQIAQKLLKGKLKKGEEIEVKI
jgi:ATP-dependent Clp protease ATP-binding subunit ClpC